jgi:hypothetical protein
MTFNRDYYLKSKETIPALSPISQENKEEQKVRIKKLESQIKAQQKSNQKFRTKAQETLRIIQSSIKEQTATVLVELESLQVGIVLFSEDESNSDEDSSLLLEVLKDIYETIDQKPLLPEWCSFNPARPWGKPIVRDLEKENRISVSNERQRVVEKRQEKIDRIAENRRRRAENEKKLWSGEISSSSGGESSLRTLRAAYIRLARAVHPDKVEDPAKRELATAFMKRVNSAYSSGDAKALFELERELVLNPLGEEKALEQTNELEERVSLLTRQLESLKKELRLLKRSKLGETVESYERALKQGFDVIEFAAPHLPKIKREVSDIRKRLSEARKEKGKIKSFFSWLKRHYFTSSDPFESFE